VEPFLHINVTKWGYIRIKGMLDIIVYIGSVIIGCIVAIGFLYILGFRWKDIFGNEKKD